MSISGLSSYLHAYEAYRLSAFSQEETADRQGEKTDKQTAQKDILVLTKQSQEQLIKDRVQYAEMLRLKMEMQNAQKQKEEAKKEADEWSKIMTIFHRISKGDRVPKYDEQKLLKYNSDLYMAAKNAQMMARNKKPKDHKSLWEEEKEKRKVDDEINMQEEMQTFQQAQANAVVEVPAKDMETDGMQATIDLGMGLTGAEYDASV